MVHKADYSARAPGRIEPGNDGLGWRAERLAPRVIVGVGLRRRLQLLGIREARSPMIVDPSLMAEWEPAAFDDIWRLGPDSAGRDPAETGRTPRSAPVIPGPRLLRRRSAAPTTGSG